MNQTAESERKSQREAFEQVARAAVAEAIERHRRLGESIVIWRDGQIVTLTGDEIPPQNVEAFQRADQRRP